MNARRIGIGMALVVAALALTAVSLMTGCLVPDNAYLMESNRRGNWREAEKVGSAMLSNRRGASASQVLETYFHVVYAKTRLGKVDEARKLVPEYDALAEGQAIEPGYLWLGREMAKLKAELGLLTDAQRTLVSAMERNGEGNYARALALCEEVLADPGAKEAQAATARFVAAVCSIRLGDAKAAEAHLEAFDRLKSALPPGHQALVEERYAREGLAKLKGGK